MRVVNKTQQKGKAMSTATLLPVLPDSLTVEVNGAPQVIAAKPNKEGSRIWYNGRKVVAQMTTDPATALGKVSVRFNGVDLVSKEGVHVSEPQKYAAGHAKAGQNKPNTGGNWTVTHSAVIDLVDKRTDQVLRYTLIITVTYVENTGFVISAKAIPPGRRGDPLVGDDPTF